MAQVVFLRGVNVGRTRRLGAKEFADKLGLVNIGAAGTFVSTADESASTLEKRIRAALPFETDVMVRPGEEILALAASPIGRRAPPEGIERFVTVLAETPSKRPRLPINQPAEKWLVSAVQVDGRLVTCLRRIEAHGKGFYPNELIEKAYDVAATTRGWPTIAAICRVLESVAPSLKVKPKAKAKPVAAKSARRSRSARRR
jgi:uncharacterized protein (DUF1697 family)